MCAVLALQIYRLRQHEFVIRVEMTVAVYMALHSLEVF